MRWTRRFCFGPVLAVLLFVAPSATAQTGQPFTVGIVEANGNLTPVATFDGASWSTPWPVHGFLSQNPPPWPDLPEDWNRGGGSLKSWTLWFEVPGPDSGLSPGRRALTATGLVKSSTKWTRDNLALATDAGDRYAFLCPGYIRCIMGIATTGESPELVEIPEPEDKDSRRIAAWVRDVFNKLESQALEPVVTNQRYDILGGYPDAVRRSEIPLRVETVFRIRQRDTSIHYLEIDRHYDSAPSFACPVSSFLRIWVLANADAKLTSLKQHLALTDCDGKGICSDTPLVFWRHAAGIDVLVRSNCYESEDYVIMTVTGGAVTERTRMHFGGL